MRSRFIGDLTLGLDNGFTSLIDNIEFPQNIYTDTVYGTSNAGFYRVEVSTEVDWRKFVVPPFLSAVALAKEEGGTTNLVNETNEFLFGIYALFRG